MPSQKHIVLDTNFLMIPGSLGLDIFAEIDRICDFKYRLFVVDKTINELEKIKLEGNRKEKDAANIALSLIKKYKINIMVTESNDYVDDLLVHLHDKGYIIATQDGQLKKKLKNNLIILRQKSYLDIKGGYNVL